MTVPMCEISAYRDSTEIAGIGVGATLLKTLEVKQRFITDLGPDFLVVEVALYLKSGTGRARWLGRTRNHAESSDQAAHACRNADQV
jgi:hypothetical protein